MGVCDNCGDSTYRSRVASFDVCGQSCETELLQSGEVELDKDLDLPNPADRSTEDPVAAAENSSEAQKELF